MEAARHGHRRGGGAAVRKQGGGGLSGAAKRSEAARPWPRSWATLPTPFWRLGVGHGAAQPRLEPVDEERRRRLAAVLGGGGAHRARRGLGGAQLKVS